MAGSGFGFGNLTGIVGRLGGALGGTGGLVLRFVLSAAIGVTGALGVGAMTSTSAIKSSAQLAPESTFSLAGPEGSPIDFAVSEASAAPPVPIEPLPDTSTIQLVSYTKAIDDKVLETGARPPWWNESVPRVPAITQFDGGPLQNSNCTMAAGAMLARLAYGVVTTGSQLRALQDNQSRVGTTLGNLEQAMDRGWGVRFFKGAITPLQLRALMFAGAGAVIQGLYGRIPDSLRLQTNFFAGHAIYLDGFRPPTGGAPAAYYVIDPLGRPASGYQGAWWPADVIEDFATTFGNGFIPAVWGFAGGIVPVDHPLLPLDAYPTEGLPTESPPIESGQPSESAPTESIGPGESVTPNPSTPGIRDPMPPGDVGTPPELDPGTIEPEPPKTPPSKFEEKGSRLSPLFVRCTSRQRPADCPKGILGVVKGGASPSPTPSPESIPPTTPRGSIRPLSGIELLFANPIGPDTYQIIFRQPAKTLGDLWVWRSDTSAGGLLQAKTDAAVLGGQDVSIATIFLDPNAEYSFVATAVGDGVRVISSVGSIEVGQ
jgi:hypothetical protein